LSTGFLDTRGDWPDHTHTKATKEALEKRVSELEKTKLTLSEELAEEQLNAKTTKTQLENKVNKLRVPTTFCALPHSHVGSSTITDPQGDAGRGDAQGRERGADEAGTAR
jgi:uncharacterized coiled-coil protein SlyX